MTNQKEIDLFIILRQILENKAIISAITVVFVIASIALALMLPPKYKSTSKIIYQTSSKTNSNLSALASLTGVSLGNGASDDPSAYLDVVLKSSFFSDLILQKEWRIREIKNLDNSNKHLLQDVWNMKPDTLLDDWAYRFQEGLRTKLNSGDYIVYDQDKKNGVIYLSTEFEDPLLSYDINVFLFEQLNEFLVNKLNFKAKSNKEFIEERLLEAEQRLAKSENDLKRFLENNRMRITPEATLEENRLQRRVNINQDVATQLQKQFEQAKIEEAKDLPVLDIIDQPRIAIDKSKPKRKQIVLLGMILGVFVGCVFVFFKSYMKTSQIANKTLIS